MKLGMMNNPSTSVYEEAELCGKWGFDFLDLTIEGPGAAWIDIDRLRRVLDPYGLSITGHTDPCLPWAYPVEGIREACAKELERCARIFSALGARVMNIHPCYFCPPAMRNDLFAFHIEALAPLVQMAASHGLTLVLENFKAPFDRVAPFKQLLEKVPGLKLHLDFGHTHFGPESHEVFCQKLGDKICHVHFSDNRGRADDHLPLGVGSLNWQAAVKALRETGYDETITLEIFCNDQDQRQRYLDLSRGLIRKLWDD